MTRPNSCNRARQQAHMWQRLAEQCRRCGDHDLEHDARMLARRYQRLVEDDMSDASFTTPTTESCSNRAPASLSQRSGHRSLRECV
ncbi:hypothetical protein [Oleiagrimonas sp. MCCC 1A03011]|uniref:hypothetical protein n=1 Tax=Oleiagrimonas sp. MCCC 1A03011 TaxID=1926883 RepID=UPI0011BD5732|nr:hypothetical protein [Oleiagrimonas sp. MCCC 1A03011]